MKWLPATLMCLLLAVGMGAADRWPAASSGAGGSASAYFYVKATFASGLAIDNCLLFGLGDVVTWFFSAPSLPGLVCTGTSNPMHTQAIFAPGVSVTTSKLTCTTDATGGPAGRFVDFGVRWRDGSNFATQTTSSQFLRITPSADINTIKGADVVSTCPYSSTGCGMSVVVVARDLGALTVNNLNCSVHYTAN